MRYQVTSAVRLLGRALPWQGKGGGEGGERVIFKIFRCSVFFLSLGMPFAQRTRRA